jgi:hypothetical protein
MSDIEMRDAAEDRLMTAELTAVMASGVGATGDTRRRWRQLYAAALVLLGCAVTFGVAWSVRSPDTPAQDRPFDPVDPWYEREWPYEGLAGLVRPVRAEQAGPEVDTFAVTLRDEDSSELAAVFDRPVVRRLALSWRNDQAARTRIPRALRAVCVPAGALARIASVAAPALPVARYRRGHARSRHGAGAE